MHAGQRSWMLLLGVVGYWRVLRVAGWCWILATGYER